MSWGSLNHNDAHHAGIIAQVEPNSLAARLGVRPGDRLLAVNGHPVRDVIDVQFYAAEEEVELTIRRDGETLRLQAERDYAEPLGLTFTHPTFDVDIRRCNNLCEFCFVLQTPPRMRRTLYIKDDDYRYSFLYGHFVTLTNLTDEDWERIAEQHLSPLYVSVHATDPALRRRVLRNPQAPDVMEQLRWLGEHGIETHTQLVITPGLNDGPHLDRSIADLVTLWPAVRSVSVVPVGITRYHKYGWRPHTPEEARRVFRQVTAWQARLLPRLGVRFAYLTDEWYLVLGEPIPPREAYDDLALQENGLGMVRDFLDDWEALKEVWARSDDGKGPTQATPSSGKVQQVTLATGTLFAPFLRAVVADFAQRTGIPVSVVPVVNERLGETITVAGLLMGRDIIRQLREHPLGDLVALPRVTFDHPDRIALDDVSPAEIAQALDRPVVLVSTLSELWDHLTSAQPITP